MRGVFTPVSACIAGILIGPLLAAGAVGGIFWTGAYDVAATKIPGDLETKIAAFAVNHAVQKRAPVQTNPFSTPEDIRAGLVSYQQNCFACHGARGIPETTFGRGLNPPAPDLTLSFVRRLSDGELYWIVSHGIRMTGMPAFLPTHTEDEIWKIVAFVRHMPDMTKEEQRALKADRERSLQSMENSQTVKKEVEHEEEPSS